MTFKDTNGKDKLRYIPYSALKSIAKVREYGIMKYKDDQGWRQVPEIEFTEAAMRHVGKALSGEDIDSESGLPHLDHAICSLALAIAVRESKND